MHEPKSVDEDLSNRPAPDLRHDPSTFREHREGLRRSEDTSRTLAAAEGESAAMYCKTSSHADLVEHVAQVLRISRDVLQDLVETVPSGRRVFHAFEHARFSFSPFTRDRRQTPTPAKASSRSPRYSKSRPVCPWAEESLLLPNPWLGSTRRLIRPRANSASRGISMAAAGSNAYLLASTCTEATNV